MRKPKAPKAPDHLSAEAQAIYIDVSTSWQLAAAAESVLTVGLEAFDRMREAQAAIARDGAYVEGRFGPKAHPAISVERDSRIAYLRSFRQLDLEAPATPSYSPPWRKP